MNEAVKVLEREIASGAIPSAQYYLFNSDDVLQSVQLGMADVTVPCKVDSNTTYHFFSVTKTFTALAVLQLAEQGLVDVNKPVVNYLPDFTYGAAITVKQLLTHSAGLPNPMPLAWVHLAEEHGIFNRNTFFKPLLEKHNKVKYAPNQKFAYSNLGYIILGQLIEQVTGLSYEEYIAQHVFHPLSVTPGELGFAITHTGTHAIGYIRQWSAMNLALGLFLDKARFMEKRNGAWRAFKPFYVNGAPYGGLVGKPSALVKYVQALLKPDSCLLSDKYRQQLFVENTNNNGELTGMCLSWFTGQLNGVRYYTHAGGGGGYYCEIRLYPELNLGSVLCFNRTGVSDERFLDKLDRYYVNAHAN